MNLHNLKITIRNAFRNGTLSFAKLFGLSISFAVILFAVVFVFYETSFDKSIADHDRIYRCLMEGRLNAEDVSFAVTSPEMAKAIKNEIPEISDAVRMVDNGETYVKYNNEDTKWGRMFYADSQFLSFFGIPLISNQSSPLASLNDMVIARSVAVKYFGTLENALNKSVEIAGEKFFITGVFNDVPKNFHLQPKIIQSIQKFRNLNVGWGSQNCYTYFKTKSNLVDVDQLNFKLTQTVYLHSNPDNNTIHPEKAKTIRDFISNSDLYIIYNAERLTDIHFSLHKFDPAITANKTYVYGAMVLSILILLISSVNFTNLTIANISTRLKNIGIQKTIGAKSNNIVRHFILESFLFLVVGFLLAFVLFKVSEKPILQYLNLDIGFSSFKLLQIATILFAALLLFNMISIFVPVLLVSKRKILSLAKSKANGRSQFSLNSGFVFFQFFLSALIILGAVIVHKQVNFMVNKDRGYDSQNIMMLVMWQMNPETRRSFIQEMRTYSFVKAVSTGDAYFGEDFGMSSTYFESINSENHLHASILSIDDDFFNTFNLKLKQGRFFDKTKPTDSDAVILNEMAARKYTGKAPILNSTLLMGDKKYHVIGVVKDFNYRSLHYPVQPLVISRVDNFGNVFIKVANTHIPEAIKTVQKLWLKYNIVAPLDYRFHDEVVAAHYMQDQYAKRLLLFLSIVSIIIACVGLYAISYFSIVKRTKEVGIRKVNGARTGEVMAMLNKDFIQWVVMAFLMAGPIAWYVMSKWLENFAYKTTLSWWVFAAAGAITLCIALLTVSWQSWRAARRNPVESLRYE